MIHILISLIAIAYSVIVNYDYNKHGDDWPTSAKFKSSCSLTKTLQSPVDLGTNYTLADEAETYFFPYYAPIQTIINKENVSLRLTPAEDTTNFGPMYTVNNLGASVSFYAKEMLFRSEAEHTINGHRSQLEIQVYHTYMYTGTAAETNKSAIVVMFDPEETAEPNAFLQSIIDNYDAGVLNINIGALIPKSTSIESYYYYQGSQTFPYCTEKVQWVIFDTIRKAPPSQLQFFYDLFHNQEFVGDGNYRNIQSFENTASQVQVRYRKNPRDEL